MPRKADSYSEFWPYYLAEHSQPATRSLHFLGTGLGLALLAAAVFTQSWWLLLAAAVSGYAFAWIAHLAVERNRPATFSHPLWSLISDFRMFALWISGGLAQELRRHGIGPGG